MYVKGRVHVFWHICEFSFPTKYTYLLELLRILRSLRGVLVVASRQLWLEHDRDRDWATLCTTMTELPSTKAPVRDLGILSNSRR